MWLTWFWHFALSLIFLLEESERDRDLPDATSDLSKKETETVGLRRRPGRPLELDSEGEEEDSGKEEEEEESSSEKEAEQEREGVMKLVSDKVGCIIGLSCFCDYILAHHSNVQDDI